MRGGAAMIRAERKEEGNNGKGENEIGNEIREKAGLLGLHSAS